MGTPSTDAASRSASRSSLTRLGWLAAGLLVGVVFGTQIGPLEDILGSRGPTHLRTTGQIDGASVQQRAGLRVHALRHGGTVCVVETDARGRFSMEVPAHGPFDLKVSNWRSPTRAHPEPADPVVLEGGLERIPWGARQLVVPVEVTSAADLAVRVVGADGQPVVGTTVDLLSELDHLASDTDHAGVARFRGLPARRWRAVSAHPRGPAHRLVRGVLDVVPSGQQVDLHVPAGIRMWVRIPEVPDLPVRLEAAMAGVLNGTWVIDWAPDQEGRMAIYVSPGQPTLTLEAVSLRKLDQRTTEYESFAFGGAAVRADAELVLEPLGR